MKIKFQIKSLSQRDGFKQSRKAFSHKTRAHKDKRNDYRRDRTTKEAFLNEMMEEMEIDLLEMNLLD